MIPAKEKFRAYASNTNLRFKILHYIALGIAADTPHPPKAWEEYERKARPRMYGVTPKKQSLGTRIDIKWFLDKKVE